MFLAMVGVGLITACTHAHANGVPSQSMWDNYPVYREHVATRHVQRQRTVKRYGTRGATHNIQRAPYALGCLTPKMRTVWALVTAHWGPLRIISTCRPGAFIRGTHIPSYHRYGMAIDFLPPSGKKGAMVQWLHLHTTGGVMTYNNFSHIHIDVGPRFLALNRRG